MQRTAPRSSLNSPPPSPQQFTLLPLPSSASPSANPANPSSRNPAVRCANNAAANTSPRNNYSGANRGHYVNPRVDELIDRYRQSADQRQEAEAIKAVSDFLASDLPLMLLYFNPTTPSVRAGVNALDDFRGGSEASRLYGTFSRNAHEWDLRSPA